MELIHFKQHQSFSNNVSSIALITVRRIVITLCLFPSILRKQPKCYNDDDSVENKN